MEYYTFIFKCSNCGHEYIYQYISHNQPELSYKPYELLKNDFDDHIHLYICKECSYLTIEDFLNLKVSEKYLNIQEIKKYDLWENARLTDVLELINKGSFSAKYETWIREAVWKAFNSRALHNRKRFNNKLEKSYFVYNTYKLIQAWKDIDEKFNLLRMAEYYRSIGKFNDAQNYIYKYAKGEYHNENSTISEDYFVWRDILNKCIKRDMTSFEKPTKSDNKGFTFFYKRDILLDKNVSGNLIKFKNNKHLIRFTKEDKWGVIDNDNKVILPAIYDFIDDFNEGRASIIKVINNQAKYGLINKSGKVILEPSFNYISSFKKGYALINNSTNIIDTSGIEINFKDPETNYKYIYDEIRLFKNGFFLLTKYQERREKDYIIYAIYNSKKEAIYFSGYHNRIQYSFSEFYNGISTVREHDDNKEFFINEDGTITKR